MYCQFCGTQNPEDARFCKACGTAIAAPGDRGGRILDDTNKAMDTIPAVVNVHAPPPAAVEPKGRETGAMADDVVGTLSGLRSQSNSRLTSASLSLATVAVRSPWRIWALLIAAVIVLLAGGAGIMVAVAGAFWAPQAVITATPAQESTPRPISLGGGDDGQFISSGPVVADLGTGKVANGGAKTHGRGQRDAAPGDAGATPSPTKTTPTPSKGPPPASQSSSTTVEAPDETPAQGGSQPAADAGTGSSGGGTMPPGFEDEGEERDIEMDMYAGQVRRVISQYYAARAQSCFDRATRNNNQLRGTVVVRFTVGPSGNVTRANPLRNTTGDDDLGACLAAQVASWRLPAPPYDQPVELEMPFSW
jgi:TonB family protein